MTTTTTNYGFLKYSSGETPWSHSSGLDAIDSELARPRIPHNSPSVGATTTLDLSLARAFKFTVSQATTLSITNVPANTFHVRFYVLVTNGAAFTLTYPGSVVHVAGQAPTLQTSGVDLLQWETWDAGTTWYVRHAGKNSSLSYLSSRMGNSTQINRVAHVPYGAVNITTVSTALVDLTTYTLQANTLWRNGTGVRITIAGTFGATANGLLNIIFGGFTVLSATDTVGGRNFWIDCLIQRRATSSQRSTAMAMIGTTIHAIATGSPTENETGSILIKIQSDQAGAGTFTLQNQEIAIIDPDAFDVA